MQSLEETETSYARVQINLANPPDREWMLSLYPKDPIDRYAQCPLCCMRFFVVRYQGCGDRRECYMGDLPITDCHIFVPGRHNRFVKDKLF